MIYSGTSYFVDYHSYWLPNGEINPEFSKHNCGVILDLKEGKEYAVNHFYNATTSHIPNGLPIVIVPSSNSENINTGIKKLGQLLAKNGRIDATSCLVRHTTIPKAAKGGPRNVQSHLNSINVQNVHLIKGKSVILLDDVTTSGSSLDACEELLIRAGASEVLKFAIANTV